MRIRIGGLDDCQTFTLSALLRSKASPLGAEVGEGCVVSNCVFKVAMCSFKHVGTLRLLSLKFVLLLYQADTGIGRAVLDEIS